VGHIGTSGRCSDITPAGCKFELSAGMGKVMARQDGEQTRERISSFVALNQGIHLSGIIRALELGNHQAALHMRTLAAEARVWSRTEGRYLRFYTSSVSPHTPPDQLPNPPVTYPDDSMQWKLLDRLARNPASIGVKGPLTQGKLASQLDCSQQLVSHHLLSLEQSGCVMSRRAGFRKVWRVTAAGLQALTGGSRSLSTVDAYDLESLISHYST